MATEIVIDQTKHEKIDRTLVQAIGIESFRDHAKALLHGAEHAVMRMKIADCRSAALAT